MATRTRDELDAGTLTAADVWGFGCSVLKLFLSHSGPHTQKQVCTHTQKHNAHTQLNSVTALDECLETCPILTTPMESLCVRVVRASCISMASIVHVT